MLVPITQQPTDLIAAVLDSLTSPLTRGAYRRELGRFTAFCAEQGMGLDRSSVQAYRAQLIEQGKGSSSISLALSAIKALVREASERGCLDEGVAGAILRVKGVERRGRRCGRWLSLADAKRLMALPDRATVRGKRDSAVLAMLLGAALRRDEACRMTVDQMQQRDGRWLFVDIEGKAHRVRSVVLPPWAAERVTEWVESAGITSGRILRRVLHGDEVGEGLTVDGVVHILKGYADQLGLALSPHDMRRSAATLAKKGGADWEQIRDFLGHGSVTTTERYVMQALNIENPAGDRMGI